MSTLTGYLTLRLLHIVLGVFWVGAVVFFTAFLLPAISRVGPAGGEVMRQLDQKGHLSTYLKGAAVLTLLTGILLYWRLSGGLEPTWVRSGPGITFGLGGLLAILAVIVGVTVSAPTAKRLGSLTAAPGPSGKFPTDLGAVEIRRLQNRLFRASALVAVLLLFATAAMAIGRYVG